MNYENKALRDLARGAPCMVNSPKCNHNPETTVWAHSDQQIHGKGTGIKAHDCFGCFACSDCHTWLGIPEARALREYAFQRAMEATMLHLWSTGAVQVKNAPQRTVERPRAIAKMLPRR